MAFQQSAPELGNQYDDDRVLRSYLHRTLPAPVLGEIRPSLTEMGERAGGDLYDLQLREWADVPRLVKWDPWGRRIDRIEVTRLWTIAERLAAEKGLVATAYEQKHSAHSRIHQMALAYLFIPSTDMYGCPLAMTDGAARTLLESGNDPLVARALPHLTSRNADTFWTSGQWMTELPGGSDVSRTETTARRDSSGQWRLYGRKWFTSAVGSQMALALARPEGNPEDSKGLALFYVELRDEDGFLQNIQVNRLKDKLGTRKLPTAELTLDGTPATPVGPLRNGVRQMAPMLTITRTWNAVTACAYMRRGMALARDYAGKRHAFGTPLADKALHLDTLAGLQAEFEASFHLAFRVVELLGEAETTPRTASTMLLRVLTPLAKLTTGRQVVQHASEIIESFGGAGYVEDTGLPPLLRDAQVLSIWEGTTNVLALDLLHAIGKSGGIRLLQEELSRATSDLRHGTLVEAGEEAMFAFRGAAEWLQSANQRGRDVVEAGGRHFALTVGRALELALLARHAQWALDSEDDARPLAAAERFAEHGLTHLRAERLTASRALALDDALQAAGVEATS